MKFINGRPLSELKEEHGVVAMIDIKRGLCFGNRSSDNFIRVGLADIRDVEFSEWVAVLDTSDDE